jgi:hypothetical protein
MKSRHRRISRATAENLLDGTTGIPEDGRLAQMVAALAAVAPATDETPGERAAIAAFRTAQTLEQPETRRRVRPALTRFLTIKAAAVTAVIIAGGGVAVAATGVISTPLELHHRPPHTPTSGHPSDSAHPATPPATAGTRTPTTTPPAPAPGPGTPASIHGLCSAYLNAPDRGKALDTPAYAVLVTAAGSKAAVPTYCATLASPVPTPTRAHHGQSAHPTPTARPGATPNPHATDRPTAKPSTAH